MPRIKKRGIEALAATVGALIIIFIGVLLIVPLLPKILQSADDSLKDDLCKVNIALRRYELQANVNLPLGVKYNLVTLQTPIKGCVTVDKKEIPRKGDTVEATQRAIADLMRDCWQRYDEGRAGDIFKEGSPWINNCQTCYVFKIKKDAKLPTIGIPSSGFYQYLATTPYKPKDITDKCYTFGSDRGGFCAASSEECQNKIKTEKRYIDFDSGNPFCTKNQKGNGCCYSQIKCWNNGGICSKDLLGSDFTPYPDWNCPKDETCWIKKEQDLTYLTYFQRANGPGNVNILTDIKPNEAYAISFGAPTEKCDATGCLYISLAVGAAAGGLLLAYLGAGPITIPLTIVGGLAFTDFIKQKIVEPVSASTFWEYIWGKRQTSAIYLSTVSQIEGGGLNQGKAQCSIIPE